MGTKLPPTAAIAVAMTVAFASHGAAQAPFSRGASEFVRDEIHVGINIGNTLDVPSGNETEWGNPPITRDLIRAYRAKGFDTVRVPVTWSKRFDHDAPGHAIEPAFLARVKEVVGWCLDEGFVTILNTHHDSGGDGMPFGWITIDGEHEAESTEMLRDLWTQIATALRDAGERLVFEVFNEPRKTKWWGGPDGSQKGQDDWTGRKPYYEACNRYAKAFAEAVRATGGNNARRYLMVPTYAAAFQESTCAGWASPEPDGDRIIADIHCYEPGDFCLWGNRKIHDPAHAEKRLGLFFPLFKKYFTDKGIPLVLGEVNAQRRWLDDLHYSPNDAERMRWARQYAEKARSFGFRLSSGKTAVTGTWALSTGAPRSRLSPCSRTPSSLPGIVASTTRHSASGWTRPRRPPRRRRQPPIRATSFCAGPSATPRTTVAAGGSPWATAM